MKTINTRIVTKHDLEAIWNDSDFVPKKGEQIIYDIEVDAEGNILQLPDDRVVPYTYPRIKVGDGFTRAKYLPFVDRHANDQFVKAPQEAFEIGIPYVRGNTYECTTVITMEGIHEDFIDYYKDQFPQLENNSYYRVRFGVDSFIANCVATLPYEGAVWYKYVLANDKYSCLFDETNSLVEVKGFSSQSYDNGVLVIDRLDRMPTIVKLDSKYIDFPDPYELTVQDLNSVIPNGFGYTVHREDDLISGSLYQNNVSTNDYTWTYGLDRYNVPEDDPTSLNYYGERGGNVTYDVALTYGSVSTTYTYKGFVDNANGETTGFLYIDENTKLPATSNIQGGEYGTFLLYVENFNTINTAAPDSVSITNFEYVKHYPIDKKYIPDTYELTTDELTKVIPEGFGYSTKQSVDLGTCSYEEVVSDTGSYTGSWGSLRDVPIDSPIILLNQGEGTVVNAIFELRYKGSYETPIVLQGKVHDYKVEGVCSVKGNPCAFTLTCNTSTNVDQTMFEGVHYNLDIQNFASAYHDSYDTIYESKLSIEFVNYNKINKNYLPDTVLTSDETIIFDCGDAFSEM